MDISTNVLHNNKIWTYGHCISLDILNIFPVFVCGDTLLVNNCCKRICIPNVTVSWHSHTELLAAMSACILSLHSHTELPPCCISLFCLTPQPHWTASLRCLPFLSHCTATLNCLPAVSPCSVSLHSHTEMPPCSVSLFCFTAQPRWTASLLCLPVLSHCTVIQYFPFHFVKSRQSWNEFKTEI